MRMMKLGIRIKYHRLAGVVGIVILIACIIHQFLIFPIVLRSKIKKAIALKEGWPMREIWSKFEFSYETHFYVFNTTNNREIEKGAKPIVEEIGPYVYDVWQEKVDQEDREEDDSLSYSVRRYYHFNEIKSKGLSDEDDEVIMPEFLRVSAGPGFNRYNPAFVFAGSKAIDIIYNNPDSVFVKRTVKTFLFDGLPMPCKGINNYFGKVVCNQFRDFHLKYSVRDEDKTYYTSVWGHFNGTFERERKLRIKRGAKNVKEVGQVMEYEEFTDFITWNNDSYCDSFHGTDGTILRPFLNSKGKDDLQIVNTIICRSLVYRYESTVEHAGLQLLRYTTDFGVDVEKRPDEICFCTHPDRCVNAGLLDLLLCTYVPWVASHPHFYQADPSLVEAVEGVEPDKEKHEMYIDVDPLTGIIVRSRMRIQFNLQLLALKKYKLMKEFPTAMLPMVWVDEVIVLPDFLTRRIKDQYKFMLLSMIVQYLIMITGGIMCAVAIYYEYKLRRGKKQSTIAVVVPTQSNTLNGNVPVKFSAKSTLKSAPPPSNLN